MVSVIVFGPVMVMLEADAFTTFKAVLATFVAFEIVQTNVLVDVKAGLKPLIVTVLGLPETSGALPNTI